MMKDVPSGRLYPEVNLLTTHNYSCLVVIRGYRVVIRGYRVVIRVEGHPAGTFYIHKIQKFGMVSIPYIGFPFFTIKGKPREDWMEAMTF